MSICNLELIATIKELGDTKLAEIVEELRTSDGSNLSPEATKVVELLGEKHLANAAKGVFNSKAFIKLLDGFEDSGFKGSNAYKYLESVLADIPYYSRGGGINIESVSNARQGLFSHAIDSRLKEVESKYPGTYDILRKGVTEDDASQLFHKQLFTELFAQSKDRKARMVGDSPAAYEAAKVMHEFMDSAHQLKLAAGVFSRQGDNFIMSNVTNADAATRMGFEEWYTLASRTFDISEDGLKRKGAKLGKEGVVTAEDIDIWRDIYDTIVTDSNAFLSYTAGNKERTLIVKDPVAFLEYQTALGTKNYLEWIADRVYKDSKRIAIAEILGPAPRETFDALKKTLQKESKEAARGVAENVKRLENLWSSVVEPRIYQPPNGFNTAMSTATGLVNVAALGGASGSALFTDLATGVSSRFALRGTHPVVEGFRQPFQLIKSLAPGYRAKVAGIVGIHSGHLHQEAVKRFYKASGVTDKIQRFSNKVFELTGLNYLTSASKAKSMESMSRVVALAMNEGAVHPRLNALFAKFGLDKHMDILKKAVDLDEVGEYVTAESIRKAAIESGMSAVDADRVVVKYAAMLVHDANTATITPGAYQLEHLQGLDLNTVSGQAWSILSHLKSFSISALHTVGRIGTHGVDNMSASKIFKGQGNNGLMASHIAITTLGGAATVMALAAVKNEEPPPIDSPEFWVRAMQIGGAGGLYLDVLLNNTGRAPIASMLSSPTIRAGDNFIKLSHELLGFNRDNFYQLRDMDEYKVIGTKAFKHLLKVTPGANLIYVRAVMDTFIMDELDEIIGVKRKKERIIEKD